MDYSRQEKILGKSSSKKLAKALVAVVGLGGIGCVTALYLAGAGVGSLAFFDADTVSESDLHRQIAYSKKDVGKPKAIALKEKIKAINPEVRARAYVKRLGADNASSLLSGFSAVCDCTDNLASRLVINDSCVKHGIPLFHAAAQGFEARALSILPGKTACLRCLPLIPAQKCSGEKCDELGILGPVAGIAACLQATECILYLSGKKPRLLNEFACSDSEKLLFTRFKIRPNPKCVCRK